ncbi:response regulator transcription factor [Alkalilimnicola sp. S0819]|uniref:response regulator transcription factor n=1 Tax=Alkalilimnicola sp. S0819 TaxID=2613922 RepID=UPI0012621FF7|nr:response regulator transcription factor [Alkalilimnicola sp. S0819]KAB7627779.1 response regulator transcription factor [Alkalilimnicola sp. S0819]MPQ15405.1 response regulator [Alkalilimnicola sp. S0819]
MNNENPPRLAIIEDDPDLREELLFFLQAKGYPAWGVGSAEAFWRELHRHPADIILLDVGLPGEDGFSALEYLRGLAEHGLIVLTARGSQEDKLRGLSLGADFYLVKPVNFAALAEAVSGLWQRMRQQGAAGATTAATAEGPDTHGGWLLEEERLHAPTGESLPLTPQEYRLLDVLCRNPGEVHSKALVHDLLFGYEKDPDTHRVDVILSRLRSKAREHELRLPIRAVFGKGVAFLGGLR